MHVSAIIVAGGAGLRFGGAVPKQFQELSGQPVLLHTLRKFESCELIHEIIVVVSKKWVSFVARDIVERFKLRKILKIVIGGSERQDSVLAGIQAREVPTGLIAIHDGVRPCVSVQKIAEAIRAGQKYGAAVLAVKPKDTIKLESSGFVDKTVPRDSLWCAQTPQVFNAEILRKAYYQALEDGVFQTDDSALVERLGFQVKLVEGEHRNIKITEPLDLKLAELILQSESR